MSASLFLAWVVALLCTRGVGVTWTTNLLILCFTKYRIRRLVGAGAAAVRWVHCGGSLHHVSQEKEMPGIGRAGTDLILAIEFLLDLFRSPARVAKTAFYGGALQ